MARALQVRQYALVSSSGPGSDNGHLADLQTLTDTKLASLDLDNLLAELLARVRDIISVFCLTSGQREVMTRF